MDQQKIGAFWTHLHWLSVLAQQGSYTAAAARLGVSKAAMSQRIAELERAAKVALVQRTTRSVRLTEAGQKLVDDTRAAFEHIEHSFAQVRDLAEQPSGLVRLTAPVALARQQLVPLLTDFLKAHPGVRIELDLLTCAATAHPNIRKICCSTTVCITHARKKHQRGLSCPRWPASVTSA
jgi:DNA-binding transcriptional LysR family regulator